jgi:hypothetical protein
VTVGATKWIATGIRVTAGELLRVTATGKWTDGSTTSGPDGAAKPWPDNFFNLADLGACSFCATTKVPNWGALIGYIGDTPPKPGSYASASVRPQALRVFYVGGNYEAKVLRTGRLWLFKNADAYSGYTVDNSGSLKAKITVLPPETASQAAARARVAALAVGVAAPLQQAWDSCAQAIQDSINDQTIATAIEALLPGAGDVLDGLSITGDVLDVQYHAGNGEIVQTTFAFGKVVFDILGEIPGFELFGIVGGPAIDCAEAGFLLSGQLGGQLGTLLRQKLDPVTAQTASIAGTWKLSRTTISCVNLANCGTDPMTLKFTNCTPTTCTMTRLNWTWKKSHPMTLKNGTWHAQFTDITASCGTQENPAQVTMTLSVTRWQRSGKDVANNIAGTYAVKLATNPPNCLGNASSLQDMFGSRS